jgi:uncharacterized protein involved in copper resistance
MNRLLLFTVALLVAACVQGFAQAIQTAQPVQAQQPTLQQATQQQQPTEQKASVPKSSASTASGTTITATPINNSCYANSTQQGGSHPEKVKGEFVGTPRNIAPPVQQR